MKTSSYIGDGYKYNKIHVFSPNIRYTFLVRKKEVSVGNMLFRFSLPEVIVIVTVAIEGKLNIIHHIPFICYMAKKKKLSKISLFETLLFDKFVIFREA